MALPCKAPLGRAVAQKALTQPSAQRRAATVTVTLRLGGRARHSRRRRGRGCGWRRGHCGSIQARRGGVVSPCRQWSSAAPRLGTLVRHILLTALCPELAPTPGSGRVRPATPLRALVPVGSLAPRGVSGPTPAGTAAVPVAAVATAAQHHLDAAARAKEQTGGTLTHTHPEQAEGAGRTRPSAPHCDGTAFNGTVSGAARSSTSLPARRIAAAPTFFGFTDVVLPALAHVTSLALPL